MHRLQCIRCEQVRGMWKSAGTPRRPSDFRPNCTVSACPAVDKCSRSWCTPTCWSSVVARPRSPDLCDWRTTLLPDGKTRRPTRLSGHSLRLRRFGLGFARHGGDGTSRHETALIFSGADGAAGRNRTCDPLLRREMLYPLSYSRAAAECTQERSTQGGEQEKVRRLPSAARTRRFQASKDTLYRSARPILCTSAPIAAALVHARVITGFEA